MATLRDIRRRISGVKSTQKITKAMKMVAAAKLRRAQEGIVSARPYARKINELLQHLSGKHDISHEPLVQVRPLARAAVVVVTSDRGLCGSFNANVAKTAAAHIGSVHRELHASGNLKIICIGRKGFDYFVKRNYEIIGRHAGASGAMRFAQARAVSDEVVEGYRKGEYDRVEIVYNEFRSLVTQKVVIEQFLPVPAQAAGATAGHARSLVDYIYEPSVEALVGALIPRHVAFQFWRVLLESNAAEQGARMAAMENATTNATDLIRELQLSYNKARQASITKELLEIVGGAEALKKAG